MVPLGPVTHRFSPWIMPKSWFGLQTNVKEHSSTAGNKDPWFFPSQNLNNIFVIIMPCHHITFYVWWWMGLLLLYMHYRFGDIHIITRTVITILLTGKDKHKLYVIYNAITWNWHRSHISNVSFCFFALYFPTKIVFSLWDPLLTLEYVSGVKFTPIILVTIKILKLEKIGIC